MGPLDQGAQLIGERRCHGTREPAHLPDQAEQRRAADSRSEHRPHHGIDAVERVVGRRPHRGLDHQGEFGRRLGQHPLEEFVLLGNQYRSVCLATPTSAAI